MDADTALAYALSKPGAWGDDPFGHGYDLAKVGPKIFFFPGTWDERPCASVKNSEEEVASLKRRFPSAAGPAPYLEKRLWVRVAVAELPDTELLALIDDSYDIVVASLPKKARPQLPVPRA